MEGRPSRSLVGSPRKQASWVGVDPNLHHSRLCAGDLMGHHVEMRNFVVRDAGRSVQKGGQKGVIFDESEESKALNRWRDRRFLEVERRHARAWRATLANLDLNATAEQFKPLVQGETRPKNLADIKRFADGVMHDPDLSERTLGSMLQTLGIPYELWPPVFERWKANDKPTMPVFAPYAAHVMTVDLFFALSIAAGFIAKERASNEVDIAYLYYQPGSL